MMRLQQLQWLCSSIKIKYILAHLTLTLNPALPALINITNKCLILNQQVMCSCADSRNLKFKTFCFVMLQQMVIWKGTLTEQSLSPLNSMDYIWAGDDRSSGLQPRWLGFGKLLPFSPLLLLRAFKCITHLYTSYYFALLILPIGNFFSFGKALSIHSCIKQMMEEFRFMACD